MSVLKDLQPANVFAYFEEICSIPHTSFHEKALSDYCVSFAKEHGLYHEQDAMGNVVIIKEATEGYELIDPIIVQGHLDMVGDKTPDCTLDLEKDGLILKIDGDCLTADKTTLGADNGIAIAYALALLAAQDIPHPRLEAVFTVSEEVGLEGASAIDLSCCRSKRLLNLDSETEGTLTVGCAGGRRIECTFPVSRKSAAGSKVNLKFTGLQGGHSGVEIHKGRANANVLMGRFLLYLKNRLPYSLIALNGGVKDNVIPNNSQAAVLIAPEVKDAFKGIAESFRSILAAEYAASDPEIQLVCSITDSVTAEVLDDESLDRILTAMNALPNGVQAMSMDLPGLVETSLNIGVMALSIWEFQVHLAVRSSMISAKEYLNDKIAALTESLNGSCSYTGDYPAWPYNRNSKLRDLCVEIYERQYGKKPVIEIIHAGLECGILSTKIPNLDCVSLGPDLFDVHTTNERVSISSVQRVWEYLKAIISEK